MSSPQDDEAPRAPSAGHTLGDGAVEPLPDAPDPTEMLTLRPPLEELEAYARQRIDALSRLGDERATLYAEALELGRQIVIQVMLEPADDDRS